MQAMNKLSYRQPQQVQRVSMDDEPIRSHMTKLEFEAFLDKEVRPKFKRGDKVTFNYIPQLKDRPPVTMTITYIEEIYTLAVFSNFRKQPKVITCLMEGGSTYLARSPIEIRPLTEEEKLLVNLHDKKVEGTT